MPLHLRVHLHHIDTTFRSAVFDDSHASQTQAVGAHAAASAANVSIVPHALNGGGSRDGPGTYSMERWDNCSEYSLVVTTRTGFGDRILDTWSTYAVFALLPLARPLADRPCRILWHSNDSPLRGKRPGQSVDADYVPEGTELRVGRCVIEHVKEHRRKLCDVCLNDATLEPPQTQYFATSVWGLLTPGRLASSEHVRDKFFGGKRVGVDKMTAAFREAARNTTIRSRRVEERFGALAGAGAGAAEGGLVGVHIRFSDKVVRFKQYRGPNSKMAATQELAEATFASVKAYLGEEMVRRRGHTRFFVGSDDPARFDEAAAFITGLGGEVVNARRRPRQSAAAAAGGELRSEEYVVDDPNATAVDDFLMLSRCYPVLQAAKYSTFSMAASLAGGSTLLNFCREPLSDNLLYDWAAVVDLRLPYLGS